MLSNVECSARIQHALYCSNLPALRQRVVWTILRCNCRITKLHVHADPIVMKIFILVLKTMDPRADVRPHHKDKSQTPVLKSGAVPDRPFVLGFLWVREIVVT